MAPLDHDAASVEALSAGPGGSQRKTWSTPRVIVSEIRATQAHVSNNPPDGTSFGVKFGS